MNEESLRPWVIGAFQCWTWSMTSIITDQLVDNILRIMNDITPPWMKHCNEFY